MADASFFGGISSGVRMPETVMNTGPLPPLNMAGMPYGLDGTPDARINYNSSLLGDIDAYAYGEPNRLSTQSSYINIPNRIQKVVPLLHLPSTDPAEKTFLLTHCVDDGDICFALQDTHMKTVDDAKGMERVYSHKNYHPFVNLATANYIMAGLSLLSQLGDAMPNADEWKRFSAALGEGDGYKYKIFDCLKPFGIAHGSERQGGGHEGTNSAVTWASNFVTTMYVDGHVQNLANVWRSEDVNAGDHLILRYEYVDLPESYTLNHYSKATVVKRFGIGRPIVVYQLVPRVLGSDDFEKNPAYGDMPYWKIAMSYVRSKAYEKRDTTYHDDSALLRGALLEACFEPTLRIPYTFFQDEKKFLDDKKYGRFSVQQGRVLEDSKVSGFDPSQMGSTQGSTQPLRGTWTAPVHDFRRFALQLSERASQTKPDPMPVVQAAPEPVPEKKNVKRRVQTTVLGESASSKSLADVI